MSWSIWRSNLERKIGLLHFVVIVKRESVSSRPETNECTIRLILIYTYVVEERLLKRKLSNSIVPWYRVKLSVPNGENFELLSCLDEFGPMDEIR